jgi:carboxypeptidase Q
VTIIEAVGGFVRNGTDLGSRVAGVALAGVLLLSSGTDSQQAGPATEPLAPSPWTETAVVLRDRALAGNVAYELVEGITRMGPRLAGTAAEHRAAAWGAERLRALGFENVRIEEFPLAVWTRGVERAEVVEPYPQPLVVTMLGGSPATPPDGLEAEAVLLETWQDLLDSPAGSLSGRIAVLLHETPRTQTGGGYGATASMRFDGPAEAEARGAVAFVIRSLGTHDHRFAHTGATRTGVGIPSFAVSPPDAEQLARAARSGAIRLRLLGTPPAMVQGHSQNVIAEVVGRDRPEEVLVIGGHLDSWDLGTGAVDDAAGIGITTAAAKLIAQLGVRPRRTIRVVWWGAEEVSQPGPAGGLAGARFYAESREAEGALADHVIASESDFGAGRIYSFNLPAGMSGTALAREATRVLAPLAIHFDAAPAVSGGPDVVPLVQRGVPAFRLNQDGTDYFDVHHTPDDVIDRIDPASLDQNVAAWAALLWLIADSDVDFRAAAGQGGASDPLNPPETMQDAIPAAVPGDPAAARQSHAAQHVGAGGTAGSGAGMPFASGQGGISAHSLSPGLEPGAHHGEALDPRHRPQ